jgi:FdhD protein
MIPSSHDVVIEVPLSVFVNGRHALTAMISPAMLEEFVAGYLYTERIIRKLEDIDSLRIEEKSAGTPSVSVLTKNPFSIMLSSKTVLSGCGGDTSYLDPDRLPKIQSDTTIELPTLNKIMKETLVSDLHTLTALV